MSVFGFSDLAFMGAAGGVAAYDADAQAYITAVETADGQALETAVKDAIDAFVRGCKTDGIWTAIKASCILAGARTLAGALVSLAGAAPTNFNFVAGDYDRKTGLKGNASNKYLGTGVNGNSSPATNNHCSVFAAELPSTNFQVMLDSSQLLTIGRGNGTYYTKNHTNALTTITGAVGFLGSSRNSSSSYTARGGGITLTGGAINTQATSEIKIFTTGVSFTNARLAFYSIGEALDLALLDARVTALINAFAAAIP